MSVGSTMKRRLSNFLRPTLSRPQKNTRGEFKGPRASVSLASQLQARNALAKLKAGHADVLAACGPAVDARGAAQALAVLA